MVFKSRKNEQKPKASGWALFGFGVIGGGSRAKKSANEDSAATSGAKQQPNFLNLHDGAGGTSLSLRLVARRSRRVDQADGLFTSSCWTKWLDAGHRSGSDDSIMSYLRENEIRVLELIRPDMVAPLSRQMHQNTGGLIINRHVSKKLNTAATTVSSVINAKCAAFMFAVQNLGSDVECERVRQQRQLNIWVVKLLISMHWPLSAFFIAVHAIEKTLRAEFPGTRFDINQFNKVAPSIGMASLLLGISCECSQRELLRAKVLINELHEVNNINDVIAKQLSIVSSLRFGCLLLKTPADWLSYYVARIRHHSNQIGQVLDQEGFYERLFSDTLAMVGEVKGELMTYCLIGKSMTVPYTCLMSITCELALQTALWHHLNTLHRKLEGSTLIAIVMWFLLFELPRVEDASMLGTTRSTELGMSDMLPGKQSSQQIEYGTAKLSLAKCDAIAAMIFNLSFTESLQDWIPLVPAILASVQNNQYVDDFLPLKLDLQGHLSRSHTCH